MADERIPPTGGPVWNLLADDDYELAWVDGDGRRSSLRASPSTWQAIVRQYVGFHPVAQDISISRSNKRTNDRRAREVFGD